MAPSASDDVPGGGLPLHGITLIVGPQVRAKRSLAEQYLFRNASTDRPALYLSTASEPLEKILRYGEALDYFDASALGTSVIYDDLGQTLNKDGLSGVLARITDLLKQRRPGVMVIDSFKALQVYASDAGAFRRFLHDLAGLLSAMPITAFWVGEYDGTDTIDAPEFAVADAIVVAEHRPGCRARATGPSGAETARQRLLSGKHAYRLSPQGL